jgi:16S rRNA G1207 methylase RsmC
MGSDISADAIHNAAINLSKLNLQAEVLVSDVLDEIHEEKKFDLIYWNYPFHYHFDKSYESMDPI